MGHSIAVGRDFDSRRNFHDTELLDHFVRIYAARLGLPDPAGLGNGSADGEQPFVVGIKERAYAVLTAMARARERVGDGNLTEPDLLILSAAQVWPPKRRNSSALGSISGLPGTTALRHLRDLVEAGLLRDEKDAMDSRRRLYTLTDEGALAMQLWATAVAKLTT